LGQPNVETVVNSIFKGVDRRSRIHS